MNDEEKLLHMFHLTEGTLSRSCTAEVMLDDEYKSIGVNVIKDGEVAWSVSREELVFAYITRDL